MEQILATEGLRHIAEKICNFLDWKSRSSLIMTNKIAIHFSASTFQKRLKKCQEMGLCVDSNWISTIEMAQQQKMEWSLAILFFQIHQDLIIYFEQLQVTADQLDTKYYHPLIIATKFGHSKLVKLIMEVGKVVPPLTYSNEKFYINRMMDDFLYGIKKPYTLMAYERVFRYFHQSNRKHKLRSLSDIYLRNKFKFGAYLIQLILNEFDPCKGNTPMHIYALYGNKINGVYEMVKFAAKILGRNSNPPDAWGATPMHIAVKLGHIDFVKALVPYWHNCLLKDRDGKTAYQIAKEKGHNEIMELMIKHTLGLN